MSDLIEQDGQYMNFTSEPWVILSPIEQSIKEKLEKYGTPLKDWDIEINYGIKTGCNEAFIINEAKRAELIKKDPKSAEIIRPILRGKDIKRYGYDFKGLYLIATHNGYKDVPRVNIDDYPAIKEWLDNGGIAYNGKEYKGYEIIAKRADQGDTPYNLRSCAYMDDFSKPKIVWASVGETYYSLVPPDIFLLDTNYFFTTNVPYAFLALLNSKIITDYINCLDIQIGNSAYRHYKYNIEKVPLIPLSTDQEKLLSDKVKNFISTGDRQILLDIENTICVLYNLSEEEKSFILTNFAR